MKINRVNLEDHFEPYILKCRPGDWEHAKRVVGWIQKLGEDHPNYDLLIIAGYIHDIGWSGLVPKNKKLSRDALLKIQPDADKQTETLVREATMFLNLTIAELDTVLRLIKATETYISTQPDEEIMVDSDNLSKTDPNHIKEKYAPSDWMSICDLFEEKLPQRIKTEKGKKLFVPLLKKLRVKLQSDRV
jgi:hypothetical protein